MNEEFHIKEGDTLPALESELSFDDGERVRDLDLAESIELVLVPSGAKVEYIFYGEVVPGESKVRCVWSENGGTPEVGTYKAEWRIQYEDGNRITFPNDGFFVVRVAPRAVNARDPEATEEDPGSQPPEPKDTSGVTRRRRRRAKREKRSVSRIRVSTQDDEDAARMKSIKDRVRKRVNRKKVMSVNLNNESVEETDEEESNEEISVTPEVEEVDSEIAAEEEDTSPDIDEEFDVDWDQVEELTAGLVEDEDSEEEIGPTSFKMKDDLIGKIKNMVGEP